MYVLPRHLWLIVYCCLCYGSHMGFPSGETSLHNVLHEFCIMADDGQSIIMCHFWIIICISIFNLHSHGFEVQTSHPQALFM